MPKGSTVKARSVCHKRSRRFGSYWNFDRHGKGERKEEHDEEKWCPGRANIAALEKRAPAVLVIGVASIEASGGG